MTDLDSLIAVSTPVVNGGDLGSPHDQLWPVREQTVIAMGFLGLASLDGRNKVDPGAGQDLRA